MADLRLGQRKYVTSIERDSMAALMSVYREAGRKHRASFLSRYEISKTIDEVFQGFPGEVESALEETAAAAAKDVASHRVYHLDKRILRTDLEARVAADRGHFDYVHDRYLLIVNAAANLDVQRLEARENRGRVIGGGFGAEGAAEGIAGAAVANAVIGMAYGLANITAKAASTIGDKRKKRELLEESETRKALGDFLCGIRLHGCRLVADSVNAASEDVVFEVVSTEAEARASALVRNVIAGLVPPADCESVLGEALELDPFSDKTWIAWLDQVGDQDGSVGNAAEALGIDAVARHKGELLRQTRARLPWFTPEQCLASCSDLEKFASRLGLPFEDERESIKQRARELDKQRRSFGGTIYATVDEAVAARRTYEDLQRRTAAQAEAARAASKPPNKTLWQWLWVDPHWEDR